MKRSGARAADQAEQDGQLQSVVGSWRYQISWKRRDEDRYLPSLSEARHTPAKLYARVAVKAHGE